MDAATEARVAESTSPIVVGALPSSFVCLTPTRSSSGFVTSLAYFTPSFIAPVEAMLRVAWAPNWTTDKRVAPGILSGFKLSLMNCGLLGFPESKSAFGPPLLYVSHAPPVAVAAVL